MLTDKFGIWTTGYKILTNKSGEKTKLKLLTIISMRSRNSLPKAQ